MAFYYYRPKISKDEIQLKAKEILAEHPEYEPIEVPNLLHQAICSSWWGQSWCSNLERYSFLSDRIKLGRKYVRSGAVIDLKINGGNINALVIGHLNEPHEVKIKIAPISPERQKGIETLASGHIHNLEEITLGNFPEGLKEIFFQKGILFPRPDEIDFSCSCSDIANLCRHTAAALYGIGVRLDKNPLYFFEMRGIEVKEFISNVVNWKIERMLANMKTDSYRILKELNLMEVFGLEVPITAALPEAISAPVDEVKTASDLQINESNESNERKVLPATPHEQPEQKVPQNEEQVKLQTSPIFNGAAHLNEELTRLKIENAILKGRLAVLLRQAHNFKTAMGHLL